MLRLAVGPPAEPTAGRTLPSTSNSRRRAGYDGAKGEHGSKPHVVVETLDHLLVLYVALTNVDDHDEVGRLAESIQDVIGESVPFAYVDPKYTDETLAEAARQQGIALDVVKIPEAKRGFVLPPRRWVVERSFAWARRCQRLVKNCEQYSATLVGFHIVALACFMLKQAMLYLPQVHDAF